jgi:hypothetical protein
MSEDPADALRRIEARIIRMKHFGRRQYHANYPSPTWPADELMKVAELTRTAARLRRMIEERADG